jgi:RNA polymerase sigma-70 factor (ECF subfamily)
MTHLTLAKLETALPAPFRLQPPKNPLRLSERESTEISRSERATQELDLVARLLADDSAAWRAFSSQYSRIIIGCIRRVLSHFTRVTNDHDVDEVYARFCYELLANDRRKLRRFDPAKGGRLSTWIGLLAKNSTYDYLRRIKRDRVCEPLPEIDLLQADVQSPFEQVALQQRAMMTTSILEQLSERDRQFVDLYFAQGMEAEDIAQKMNISVKTVYTKRHKITARLESLMAVLA